MKKNCYWFFWVHKLSILCRYVFNINIVCIYKTLFKRYQVVFIYLYFHGPGVYDMSPLATPACVLRERNADTSNRVDNVSFDLYCDTNSTLINWCDREKSASPGTNLLILAGRAPDIQTILVRDYLVIAPLVY